MIRLHRKLDPFGERQTELVAWTPGMRVRDVLTRDLLELPDLCVARGSVAAGLEDVLSEGDHVHVYRRPEGPALGVALFGTTLFTVPTGVAFAAVFIGNAALSYLLGRLIAPAPKSKERGDEASPTYSFSGIQPSRAEGQAIPIIYGLHRVAGQIINEFLDSVPFPPSTDYYVMICLGEGPIQAIGDKTADNATTAPFSTEDPANPLPIGLQINGNPAENFDGIEAHVRLGTADQEAVPGFEDTNQQTGIAATLTATEDTTGAGAGRQPYVENTDAGGKGYANTAYVDPFWNLHGVAFDVTDESDGFSAVVQFPRGLIGYKASTGEPELRRADFLLRYIELDGSNNPITSGGPSSDGYVRLPPEPAVIAQQPSPFFAQFTHRFADPQTYAYPTVGKSLVLDGTDDYANNTAPTLPASWDNDADRIEEFTATGWFNVDEKRDGNHFLEFGDWSGANKYGWRVGYVDVLAGWPTQTTHHTVVAEFANGTTAVQKVYDGLGQGNQTPQAPSVGAWHHFAVRYQRNWSAGRDFMSLHINGVQVNYQSINVECSGSTSAAFTLGATTENIAGTGSSWKMKGQLDEVVVYSRFLSHGEVLSDYGKGRGINHQASADLVAGWHFDTATTTTPDLSSNGNDLTLRNGAVLSAAGAGHVVSAAPGVTLKRSKYRVELMRINPDSSHQLTVDDAEWHSIIAKLDQAFSYPGRAVLAMKIAATEQLHSGTPTVTALVKGRKVPIWDGASTENPVTVATWSANPAWCALDLIVNADYGLGNIYSIFDVDLDSLQAWADYCDHLVWNGLAKLDATASEWADLYFFFDTGLGKNVLLINPAVGATPAGITQAAYDKLRNPVVGDYLSFADVPTAPSTNDINLVDGALDPANGTGGYRVGRAVKSTSGRWAITLEWPAGVPDPWQLGTNLSTHVAVEGVIRRQERRFEFNGVYDRAGPAWDALLAICRVGRAMPIRIGNTLRFRYERSRSPIDVIGLGSILEDTFEIEYGGNADRPNALSLDFMDRDNNYERSTIRVEHSSITDPASFDNYREETRFMEGVTSERQTIAAGAFELNLYHEIKRQGSFRLGPDGLPYEPGDVVVLDHSLLQRGESGRCSAVGTTATAKLDRDVTLTSSGLVYELRVRDTDDGTFEMRTIDQSAIGAYPHTFARGTAVPVSTAFSFTPDREDPYVFSLQGRDLRVQIVSLTLERDLSRDVRWMEYVEGIYDDPGDVGTHDTLPRSRPVVWDTTVPANAEDPGAEQVYVATQSGGHSLRIALGWRHPDPEVIARTAILLQRSAGGPWEEIGGAWGRASAAVVTIDGQLPTDTITLALQPVSTGGARRRPERCTHVPLQVRTRALAPSPPTTLVSSMERDRALYVWRVAQHGLGLTTEIRRGGWILGQRIGVAPQGAGIIGPTIDWASGRTNDRGEKAPNLYARHISSAGVPSRAIVRAFDADYTNAIPLNQQEREDVCWEDSAWTIGAGDTVPRTLGSFAIATDLTGRPHLEFSGASLTSTFTTSKGLGLTGIKPRRVYCEAFVEAVQVHPTPVDAWPAMAGPDADLWTMEGPMLVPTGHTANCTIALDIELGGVWVAFTPGIYRLDQVRFRFTVTRQTTGYDVRVYRFATRVRRIEFLHTDRSAVQLAGEHFLNG